MKPGAGLRVEQHEAVRAAAPTPSVEVARRWRGSASKPSHRRGLQAVFGEVLLQRFAPAERSRRTIITRAAEPLEEVMSAVQRIVSAPVDLQRLAAMFGIGADSSDAGVSAVGAR